MTGISAASERPVRVVGVVVTYNRLDLLRRCIDALRSQTQPLADLVVVNNGSTDGTAEWLDAQPDIVAVHQDALGPASGLHAGVTRALQEDCDFIWTFDDDAIARPDALERLLASPANTAGNIVGSLVVSDEDPALLAFPMPKLSSYSRLLDYYREEVNSVAEVEAEADERGYAWGMFTNATLLPRSVVEAVGLAERDFYMGGEETEYFYRVRHRGYGTFLVLDSLVDHPRKLPDAISRAKEMSLARNTVHTHRQYRRWFLLRTAKRFASAILQRKTYLLKPLWHGLRGDFSRRYDGATTIVDPTSPDWRSHPVTRTLVGLYVIQVATLLVPLLTLPYLARVLDTSTLGLVFFAQAFAALVTAVLDYGFELSATRDVAQNLDDRDALAHVVAGVFGAKVILFLATGVVALGMGLAVPLLRDNPEYLVLGWAFGVAQGLSPLWYFLGIERMRTVTLADLGARLVAGSSIFVLIHSPGDGWKVIALQAGATTVGMGYALVRVYGSVRFILPGPRASVATLKNGASLAVFRGATILRIHVPALLVGVLTSARQVGFYGVADRLNRVPASILWPIYQAVYARLNYLLEHDPVRAERLRRSSAAFLFVLAAVIAVVIALLAPFVVTVIFGDVYEPAIDMLRVLAFVVPFHAFVNAMGVHYLLPLRRDLALALPVAGGVLASLVLGLVLVPSFGASAMAWAVVAGEVITAVVMYIVASRRGFSLNDTTAGLGVGQAGVRGGRLMGDKSAPADVS